MATLDGGQAAAGGAGGDDRRGGDKNRKRDYQTISHASTQLSRMKACDECRKKGFSNCSLGRTCLRCRKARLKCTYNGWKLDEGTREREYYEMIYARELALPPNSPEPVGHPRPPPPMASSWPVVGLGSRPSAPSNSPQRAEHSRPPTASSQPMGFGDSRQRNPFQNYPQPGIYPGPQPQTTLSQTTRGFGGSRPPVQPSFSESLPSTPPLQPPQSNTTLPPMSSILSNPSSTQNLNSPPLQNPSLSHQPAWQHIGPQAPGSSGSPVAPNPPPAFTNYAPQPQNLSHPVAQSSGPFAPPNSNALPNSHRPSEPQLPYHPTVDDQGRLLGWLVPGNPNIAAGYVYTEIPPTPTRIPNVAPNTQRASSEHSAVDPQGSDNVENRGSDNDSLGAVDHETDEEDTDGIGVLALRGGDPMKPRGYHTKY